MRIYLDNSSYNRPYDDQFQIKRDDFDYTVWQREYFDKMKPGVFAAEASAYADSHPYTGKAQVL
ncbi:MAG TPA: hypothetical protein DD414_11895 [Lachnospiraceae bacterium]|nr:hypothetical protein [Lachnospiraceae bacterium]